MAKRTQERAPDVPELTRKQSYMSKRDRTAQRVVLTLSGAIVLSVIVLLGIGLYRSGVLAPAQTIATVNGETIAARDFRNRVRLSYYLETLRADPAQPAQAIDPEVLGQNTLDGMVTEVLVRQTAAEMGLTVSEAEIDDRIRQTLGFPTVAEPDSFPTPFPTPLPTTPTATSTFVFTPTPSPTVEGAETTPTATASPTVTLVPEEAGAADSGTEATPSVTPTYPGPTEEEETAFREAYAESLAAWTAASGLTEADIRALFEYEVFLEKLYDDFSEGVPVTGEQALVAHIVVDTPEEADRVLARLDEGETFAELAAELSTDPVTAYRGGEIGWVTKDQFDSVSPAFSDLVFSLPEGEPGGPVQTIQGYHVVLVRGREEVPLSQTALFLRQQEEFGAYLAGLRTESEENIEIDADWQRFLPSLG